MSSGVKKRLSATVWIGNFGSFATEFQVLKFAQQIGNVEKFDFMYHDNTSTGRGLKANSESLGQAGSLATNQNFNMKLLTLSKG